MNKKQLSERDICTKFITPALGQAGWDVTTQILEEFPLTKGRIIVRGKLHTRAKHKRADYVLFYKPNIPIAIIEAKDNSHSVGDGMQQALAYAEMLQVPFVFSSNGDGFLFHNLDMIISVGYRVKSAVATRFRIWATQLFFKQVQNKMHWAAHGHTAVELIYQRADAGQRNMGTTNFPGRKLLKRDVEIAKNYLKRTTLMKRS